MPSGFSTQVGTFHRRDLFPAFRDREEVEYVSLAWVLASVTLIPNNQYIIKAHLEVTCPGP